MGGRWSLWGRGVHSAIGLCLLGHAGLSVRCAEGLKIHIAPQTLEAFFVLLLYDVGLSPGAVVSLNVSNAKPTNGTVLVILTHSQLDLWMDLPPGDSPSSYLVSYWRQPLHDRLIARHEIQATKNDRYYVGVLNVHRRAMELEGEVDYVNPMGQHLPVQRAHLPAILWVSSTAFMVLMLAISLLLSLVWQRGTTLLHALLLACLWLKSAELALKWKCFDLLARQGTRPAWRYKVWNLTSKMHSICEILLFLLTALGWRVLRPRLSVAEIRVIVLVVGLAAVVALIQVFGDVDSDGVEPLVTFIKMFFYIVRVLCYLVIIFAMNFNLQLIAVHLAESPVTPTVAILYRKQQAYMDFRRLFLAVVFRPTALMWLKVSVLNAEETEWVVDAFYEASLWAIYAALFAILRPGSTKQGILELVRAVTMGDATGAASVDPIAGDRQEVAPASVADGARDADEATARSPERRPVATLAAPQGQASEATARLPERRPVATLSAPRGQASEELDYPSYSRVAMDGDQDLAVSYVPLASGD